MKRALLLPLLSAFALVAAPAPGRALTTVCTAQWASTTGNPITSASGLLAGPVPSPCPSAVTASVQVGTGANAGTINGGDAIGGTGTDAVGRTRPQSIDLGIKGSTTETLTLSFTQVVDNPYLFFTFTDAGDSIVFADPFVLIDSNNAQASGSTVSFVGATNTQNDGFIARVLGSYQAISFQYVNANAGDQSVAFTAGVNQVPGPLPVMGAGVAFGFSRHLRRRIKA